MRQHISTAHWWLQGNYLDLLTRTDKFSPEGNYVFWCHNGGIIQIAANLEDKVEITVQLILKDVTQGS